MATYIRPELSTVNKYWISKHRYYELKHFCLQYPEWRKFYSSLTESIISSPKIDKLSSNYDISDLTSKYAIARASYADKMRLIEDSAAEADEFLASYILKAVTEDLSYLNLKSRLEIPCGKDMYYDRYRKFFWILSNKRN